MRPFISNLPSILIFFVLFVFLLDPLLTRYIPTLRSNGTTDNLQEKKKKTHVEKRERNREQQQPRKNIER